VTQLEQDVKEDVSTNRRDISTAINHIGKLVEQSRFQLDLTDKERKQFSQIVSIYRHR